MVAEARPMGCVFARSEPRLLGGPTTLQERFYNRFGYSHNIATVKFPNCTEITESMGVSYTFGSESLEAFANDHNGLICVLNGVMNSDYYYADSIPEYQKDFIEWSLSHGCVKLILVDHGLMKSKFFDMWTRYLNSQDLSETELHIVVSQEIIYNAWKNMCVEDVHLRMMNFTLAFRRSWANSPKNVDSMKHFLISCRASNNRIFSKLEKVVEILNSNYREGVKLTARLSTNLPEITVPVCKNCTYRFNDTADIHSIAKNCSYYICASFYDDRPEGLWYTPDWGIVEALEDGLTIITTREQEKTLTDLGIKCKYFSTDEELEYVLAESLRCSEVFDNSEAFRLACKNAQLEFKELFLEGVNLQ